MDNCEIEYRIFVDEGYVEWPENESFVDYDVRDFRVGDIIALSDDRYTSDDRYAIEDIHRTSQYSRNILVKKFN